MIGMPLQGLAQIAYVTNDLDATMRAWVQLHGAGPFFVGEFRVPDQQYRGRCIETHVRVAVAYCGLVNIELVQSLSNERGVFGEIASDQGPALHHVWRPCADFDAEMTRWAATGHEIVACGDWPGLGRAAFVDTRKSLGCFTEVIEASPQLFDSLDRIRKAHKSWNGQNPIRPYAELARSIEDDVGPNVKG